MTTPYAAGTATVTKGSNIVAGTGTNWISAMIEPGDIFNVVGAQKHEIAKVIDDTHLSLVIDYTGVTAVAQGYVVGRALNNQTIDAIAAKAARSADGGIAANLTVIPEECEMHLRSNEQALVFGSLTVNGSYQADGELRVQAWPT